MSTEKPIGRILTKEDVSYFRGDGDDLVLPRGEYDVHHLSPWGPVLYETNEDGCRLIVRDKQVQKWTERRGTWPES